MKVFLYDITRLYHWREAKTPTGIDRVDLNYALYIKKHYPDQMHYIFNHADRLFLLDKSLMDALVTELDKRWNRGKKDIDQTLLKTIIAEIGKVAQIKQSATKNMPKNIEPKFSNIARVRSKNARKYYYDFKEKHNRFTAGAIVGAYLGISYPKQVFLYHKRKLKGKENISTAITFDTTGQNTVDKDMVDEDKKCDSLSNTLQCLLLENQKNIIYYINISQHNIDNELAYDDLYSNFSVEFIFYIHDLIPISFPEYTREGARQKHVRKIDTVLSLKSSLILVNSEYTKNEILRYAIESKKFKDFSPDRIVPMIIGTEDQLMAFRTQQSDTIESLKNKTYFVIVSTIEPRKNHLLLLNLWRELAEKMGNDKVPKLIIIGKRGWENENIVDMLDRCHSLRGHVHEISNLGDAELFRILKGSRALLFPTFVEGWGLPLVEAMTLNVPVICSDIPVLKESGQGLAEYVSPINGEAWEEIILDYAQNDSQRRAEQIARLKNFKIPQWDKHFKDFDNLLAENG